MVDNASEVPAGVMALDASIELSPRQIVKDRRLLGMIPAGTRVYILDTGKTEAAAWAEAACTLVEEGLVPVPHIAARRLTDRGELADRVAALTGEAGVDDVLVIGGGVPKPLGPFSSSMEVLETGLLERNGIRSVGIAGHPDGSPDIAPDVIEAALIWKIAWGERTGVALRIVTQFGFDAAAIPAWSARLEGLGSRLPVHLGIAGPTGLSSLLRYAALCGVRTSMAVAARRGAALSALVTSYTPEPLAWAVEKHIAATPSSPIVQLHVYPFGGLAATAHWLTNRGSWAPRAAAEGDPE
jgi:methylenetetrahydrofolate reductase (NADPH)